jgi:surface polysaccharide O-acyltransferase-like enzyme
VGIARHLAVVIAAIVFFVLGAIWYTVWSGRWLAAIGKTMEQISGEQAGSPLPYVIGFAGILVMCYTLSWLIERLHATTLAGGMRLGAIVGIGFVSANLALNYGFEWRPVTLWMINAVYAIVGLAIAGAIIGGWKRRRSDVPSPA